MEKDFVIDKVKWHTQRIRNYEFDNSLVFAYFRSLFRFLQDNDLSTRQLLEDSEDITEETELKKSDLTEEGFDLIKRTLDRWTTGILDKGKSPNDVTYLARQLAKLRAK